jgi:hypothetical protein
MERRTRGDEVVTIEVLHERGGSNRRIDRQLGVTEHAVRFRLRKGSGGRPPERAAKALWPGLGPSRSPTGRGSSESYHGVNG